MDENDHIILNEDLSEDEKNLGIRHDPANPAPAVKRQLAQDLNIEPNAIEAYFQYYYLNSRFPIRKLSIEEQAFCRAVLEIKYMDVPTLLGYLAQYHIDPDEHRTNRLLLPRKIAGLEDDANFRTFLKWSDYLLEPYLTYKNANPPLLRPLSKMELFLIVSNVASGNSMIPGQPVDVKQQLIATQKLIDAYSLIPNDDQIEDDEEDVYEDLTPAELKAAAKLLVSPEARAAIPVKVKKKAKKN